LLQSWRQPTCASMGPNTSTAESILKKLIQNIVHLCAVVEK